MQSQTFKNLHHASLYPADIHCSALQPFCSGQLFPFLSHKSRAAAVIFLHPSFFIMFSCIFECLCLVSTFEVFGCHSTMKTGSGQTSLDSWWVCLVSDSSELMTLLDILRFCWVINLMYFSSAALHLRSSSLPDFLILLPKCFIPHCETPVCFEIVILERPCWCTLYLVAVLNLIDMKPTLTAWPWL